MADCVYGGSLATGNNTSCHLTTAWVIDAAYEHFWSPNWHESFVGAYMQVQYDNTANAILCSMEGGAGSGGIGSAAVAGTACNNNFSYWGAGSRLQWDVTKSFYIGVEALYMKLNSASAQASGIIPVNLGLPAASTCSSGTSCVANNQSDWAFTIRMHKDFLP
jgi:hypothetical protein